MFLKLPPTPRPPPEGRTFGGHQCEAGGVSLTFLRRLSRFRFGFGSLVPIRLRFRVPLPRLQVLLGPAEVLQELGAGGAGEGLLGSPAVWAAPTSIFFLLGPGPAPPRGPPPQAWLGPVDLGPRAGHWARPALHLDRFTWATSSSGRGAAPQGIRVTSSAQHQPSCLRPVGDTIEGQH